MTSVPVQRRVGRYEILGEVGRGATAVVYLARQADLDRNVALKELAAFHAADPAFMERFLRESRLAGSLNHPNIVTVHEYFEHDGVPFIAMEYLERGSLRPHLTTLELPKVIGVLEGLLAGLAHAHARGVVHRDLKPENVMVTTSGGVKIADFGIAKVLEAESASSLTLTGTTVGTPAYMAPEQAIAADVGPQADLYSVGVLAYEMLSGVVPFHGSEIAMAIMLQHLHDPVPPLCAARPELDLDVCLWVERMLAKDAQNRPTGAVEASEELDEIVIRALGPRWRRQSRLTGPPVAALAPHHSHATVATKLRTTRRLSKPRRLRAAVLGIGLGLILIAAGMAAAFALTKENQAQAPPPERTTERAGTTTRTTSTVAPIRLAGVDLSTREDPVVATLRLTGLGLHEDSIRVRDNDVTDGHAWFVLRQTGIRTNTTGVKNDALSVRVRNGKNFLRVDLRAGTGALTGLEVRRADEHTVVATASKPAAQNTGSQSSTGTGTATDNSDSTTTATETTPKDPFGSR